MHKPGNGMIRGAKKMGISPFSQEYPILSWWLVSSWDVLLFLLPFIPIEKKRNRPSVSPLSIDKGIKGSEGAIHEEYNALWFFFYPLLMGS
jgi:hypothetical protein